MDVLAWMGRTALELVGQGGLGYSFDPLVEDVPNAFGDSIKALVYVVRLFSSSRIVLTKFHTSQAEPSRSGRLPNFTSAFHEDWFTRVSALGHRSHPKRSFAQVEALQFLEINHVSFPEYSLMFDVGQETTTWND